MTMTLSQFEELVWAKEGIRICVRAPRHLAVERYDRPYRARAKKTIHWFIENRIRPLVGDHDVFIVDGAGEVVPGQTLIETVRASYRR